MIDNFKCAFWTQQLAKAVSEKPEGRELRGKGTLIKLGHGRRMLFKKSS